jgi:hypothetical protein
VYRSTSAIGPFSLAADWNLATGQLTKVPGVTNVWKPPWTSPPFTTLPGLSAPQHFQYIEYEAGAGGTEHRFFRITGYNDAGEGPASRVECGAPIGVPQC